MSLFSPSILAADFSNLREEIKKVDKADFLHLDVMDGRFVPNISFGPGLIKALRPYSSLRFDTHLMIVEPEKYIATFAEAGSDLITVHAEAATHLDRVISQIKDNGCKAGVALNPATPLNILEYVFDKIDYVLLMTVNPGYGGQSFIPLMFQKIEKLKGIIQENNLDIKIEIDGGVNLDNINKLSNAGVDIFVAGSAIFKTDNPADTLTKMREKIK